MNKSHVTIGYHTTVMRDIQRLAASATATLMFLSGTVVLGFPSTHDPEASDGNCVHKFPVADEIPHPVTLEPRRHVVRRSPEHQLRVKVFYDETVEQLPKHKRKIVEKVPGGDEISFRILISTCACEVYHLLRCPLTHTLAARQLGGANYK